MVLMMFDPAVQGRGRQEGKEVVLLLGGASFAAGKGGDHRAGGWQGCGKSADVLGGQHAFLGGLGCVLPHLARISFHGKCHNSRNRCGRLTPLGSGLKTRFRQGGRGSAAAAVGRRRFATGVRRPRGDNLPGSPRRGPPGREASLSDRPSSAFHEGRAAGTGSRVRSGLGRPGDVDVADRRGPSARRPTFGRRWPGKPAPPCRSRFAGKTPRRARAVGPRLSDAAATVSCRRDSKPLLRWTAARVSIGSRDPAEFVGGCFCAACPSPKPTRRAGARRLRKRLSGRPQTAPPGPTWRPRPKGFPKLGPAAAGKTVSWPEGDLAREARPFRDRSGGGGARPGETDSGSRPRGGPPRIMENLHSFQQERPGTFPARFPRLHVETKVAFARPSDQVTARASTRPCGDRMKRLDGGLVPAGQAFSPGLLAREGKWQARVQPVRAPDRGSTAAVTRQVEPESRGPRVRPSRRLFGETGSAVSARRRPSSGGFGRRDGLPGRDSSGLLSWLSSVSPSSGSHRFGCVLFTLTLFPAAAGAPWLRFGSRNL